jgi:thioredoxin 1
MELLVFTAEWCGPCKKMKPIIDTLADKFGIKVKRLDVEESDEAVELYSIRSIPTIVVVKDGRTLEKISGYMPSEVLESKLNMYL